MYYVLLRTDDLASHLFLAQGISPVIWSSSKEKDFSCKICITVVNVGISFQENFYVVFLASQLFHTDSYFSLLNVFRALSSTKNLRECGLLFQVNMKLISLYFVTHVCVINNSGFLLSCYGG